MGLSSEVLSDPMALARLTGVIAPVAVLLASLAGSLHCVGMCGGLVVAVASDRKSAALYHLGRLLGYTSLGAAAGLAGEQVLRASMYGTLAWISALAIGGTFVALGISHLVRGGAAPHLRMPGFFLKFYQHTWKRLLSLPSQNWGRPFGVGLLSVFLPCGWLYGFVLAAAATQSTLAGILFLFLFWLGSVPALTLAPALIQRVLRPLASRLPNLAGILLVTAGLATIGLKISPLVWPRHQAEITEPAKTDGMPPDCPMHRK